MIADLCEHLRRELQVQIDAYTHTLIRGTQSRDEDQYIRGKIFGLTASFNEINAVEERIRRAQESDATE